jgi:hypothetical protein
MPVNIMGWIKRPRVVTRPFRLRGRGKGRKVPRLASGSPRAQRLDEQAVGRELRDQPWQQWRIKDGEKGPMVWEIKHCTFHPRGAMGCPASRCT